MFTSSLLGLLEEYQDGDHADANEEAEFHNAAKAYVSASHARAVVETSGRWRRCGDPQSQAAKAALILRRLTGAHQEVQELASARAALEDSADHRRRLEQRLAEAEAEAARSKAAEAVARQEMTAVTASMLESVARGERPVMSGAEGAGWAKADPSKSGYKSWAGGAGGVSGVRDFHEGPRDESGRGLIEALAASRLGGTSREAAGLRAALGRALEKLSVDLYSSSASVLYELIANADDASFLSLSGPPTVAVSLRDRTLRFSSNEVRERGKPTFRLQSIREGESLHNRWSAFAVVVVFFDLNSTRSDLRVALDGA